MLPPAATYRRYLPLLPPAATTSRYLSSAAAPVLPPRFASPLLPPPHQPPLGPVTIRTGSMLEGSWL